MHRATCFLVAALAALSLYPSVAGAEILAMLTYESKPDQSDRREGIAIIDVDPESETFGKVLMDILLPPDMLAHHIFYNKGATKAYLTALGQNVLHVLDMKRVPYRLKRIDVSGCVVGEDMALSDYNKTWYLSCMGSDNIIVGDAIADRQVKEIKLSTPYPHGIAFHDGIDRMLVTSTVRPADLGDPGERVTVVRPSTGTELSNHKVSSKPSPSGEAPVEIHFLPGSNPPLAYITNMFGGTLWTAEWKPADNIFEFEQAFDFGPHEAGVPLAIYFNEKGDRLYVTTAKPGQLHVFDIGENPRAPKLMQSIATAAGAHHVAFSPDERYAFVQNSLLNLPGMSDGSITVIDLEKGAAIADINTLKNQGYNPNNIVLLPQWHRDAGH